MQFYRQYLILHTVKGLWLWPHQVLEDTGVAYRYLNGVCTLTHVRSGLMIVATPLPCEQDAMELCRRVARLANWQHEVKDMQKIARRKKLKEKVLAEIAKSIGWLELEAIKC